MEINILSFGLLYKCLLSFPLLLLFYIPKNILQCYLETIQYHPHAKNNH